MPSRAAPVPTLRAGNGCWAARLPRPLHRPSSKPLADPRSFPGRGRRSPGSRHARSRKREEPYACPQQWEGEEAMNRSGPRPEREFRAPNPSRYVRRCRRRRWLVEPLPVRAFHSLGGFDRMPVTLAMAPPAYARGRCHWHPSRRRRDDKNRKARIESRATAFADRLDDPDAVSTRVSQAVCRVRGSGN